MKNRQLGNGFHTIRAIRFFLSVFSIYQRLQNWRSLLINIAGCSCSDFVLLHAHENKNKRKKAPLLHPREGGRNHTVLYFQEGAAAGEAPALFKAALNVWWSQVFKMSARIPQKIAFGEQTPQQGGWSWMILRSLQLKPFRGSVVL